MTKQIDIMTDSETPPEEIGTYEVDYYKSYMNLIYNINEAKKQIEEIIDIASQTENTLILNKLKKIQL